MQNCSTHYVRGVANIALNTKFSLYPSCIEIYYKITAHNRKFIFCDVSDDVLLVKVRALQRGGTAECHPTWTKCTLSSNDSEEDENVMKTRSLLEII